MRKLRIGGKCKYGHDLTEDNVRIRADRNGCVECVICLHAGRKRFNVRKPLYDVWQTMIRRCSDPTFKDWTIYGGREVNPVAVCERWLNSYDAFAEDMGARPSSKHTLDRKNGEFGYFPNNCRWATPKEQARNCRTNRMIEFNASILTLAEWAERSGLKYGTLLLRLRRGIPFEEAFTTPVGMPGYLKRKRDSEGRFI